MLIALETSTDTGSAALISDAGIVVAESIFRVKNGHSALLEQAVRQVLANAGATPADLTAVALSAGPGSYTGLRIGAGLAKGLCVGLGFPLYAVSTLQGMAWQARHAAALLGPATLLCPMLDARRMEVYTALYDQTLAEISPAAPVVPEDNFQAERGAPIVYFGPGAAKLQALFSNAKHLAYLAGIEPQANAIAQLAFANLQAGYPPADLNTWEPDYLKAFGGRALG